MNKRPALSGLSEEELIKLVKEFNWPSFKGKQIHSWIYKKWVKSFDEMTDLSTKEREYLKENFKISPLELANKQISKDKTIKYLWKLHDNTFVESVRMFLEDHDSYSVCISSQIGCAVGCPFCATGKIGFKRNLQAIEIIDQILSIQRDTKQRISNVVFMGQGEPLLNFDEVVKAIHLIKDSVSIGARKITVSTSGVSPYIDKLADEKLQITLAVSLHAPDQETREYLVPIAKKYKMKELMKSLHNYYERTKRRITIEYVLLENINDAPEQAKALGELLKGLHCHINLIPYNPIERTGESENRRIGEFTSSPAPQLSSSIAFFKRTPMAKIYKFKEILELSSHKKVTIRHGRGLDIDAACGQLANIQLRNEG